MKISGQRNILPVILVALVAAFVGSSYISVNSFAQDKIQFPARTGYVNDFAGVVDQQTKQRLEVMLANLKQRSGIEFDVVTIQTTGTKDIFDVSRDLAADWNVGARNSRTKSLLLVIAVNEKTAFTQFSKSVQGDLPEGILGELGLLMRGPISSGHFSEGLNNGVFHFINVLAKKVGFATNDIDQVQVAMGPSSEPAPSAAAVTSAENPPAVVKTSSEDKVTVTSPPVSVTNREGTTPTLARTSPSKNVNTPEDDADEAEEVELVLTLPLAERIRTLKEFLAAYPNSKARPRALELIVSTYAGLGDQKLKNGDSQGGIEQMMLAISEAPLNTTDQLFSGVIAQIPSNLFIRNERTAAYDAARKIESKFGADAKRLLVLAAFYLGIEDGEEAARVAAQAVKLSPELADAHRVLGLGLHLSLRLDEAAAEYKRALELDPKSQKATRRSLADLHRAGGKTEAALSLYREQLVAEPTDRAARAGVVLSLLELGRADEGKKELEAALANNPDLILLAGASYWFAAHNDPERALELAQKAVGLEPRYTWAQIAKARALSGLKKPLEAERAIRFAGQYGKFPTLDYELASVLASVGLYDEAAEVLQRSFSLRQGQIETRLAGRVLARSDSFTELLARERRASIFQFTGAERAGDSAMLKALLAFTSATQISVRGKLDEVRAAITAKEFGSGTDAMRAYRQMYAANRLLKRGVAFQTAYELTEAARSGVDAALQVPGVTVAVQAEELRDMRARARAQAATPDVPEAPPNVLANILRGRVEDLAGMALFNQDKTTAALEHLKRAVTILPEGTPAWRDALWHLGTALDQAGDKQQALDYYIRSYNAGAADPLRRSVIEQLYRKTNGSLDGLDDRVGSKIAAINPGPTQTIKKPVVVAEIATPSPEPEAERVARPEPTPAPSANAAPVEPVTSTPVESIPAATPTPEATPMASPTPEATPSPESSPSPRAEAPVPAAEPTPQPGSESPAPQTGETRTRFADTIKVTGKVKDANGEGIANVIIALISPRGTVLTSSTDMEGNYSFLVSSASQSYRILPSKDGFTFEPVVKVLTRFNEDQKAVDFVGTRKS